MQDSNYDEMIRKHEKFKLDKEAQYKDISKERLLKISKKKVQTTMIGALSTIEEHFGFLWGHGSNEQLTPEQEHAKGIYDKVRSEILDRGNNQNRNLEAEFAQYDIKWLRYQMTLPVVNRTTLEGEEDEGRE
jgi:hypothetical protein|tara:strand:- start:143 stop:538 length:396 start_codon:yes stop_codon:yes gene_type:complete